MCAVASTVKGSTVNCPSGPTYRVVVPPKWSVCWPTAGGSTSNQYPCFHLKNARLYAFWVSPDETGASGGHLAAGGPGLRNRDA
jgi:hypothetical protein